jgi:cytochrome b561
MSYISVYFRHWFTEPKTTENWTALQLHLSIGITIFVIVVLRLTWKAINKSPLPEPGTKFMHFTAMIGHVFLYLLLIIMPITGYIGTGANTEYFFLFDIPKFEDTALYHYIVSDKIGMTFKEFEKPIDYLHKNILGSWLLWILITGHAAAALYHTYIRKDRILYKML